MISHCYLKKRLIIISTIILIFSLLLSSCSIFNKIDSPINPIVFTETKENYPQAEVIFQVRLPSPLPYDEKLLLEIIDDVTGVYFNPSHFEMTAQDAQNFFVRLPLTVGEKIKYRFARKNAVQTIYEATSQNKVVHDRVLLVEGSILTQDLVAAWSDQPFSGAVGRIRGQLVDSSNNSPLPNMVVYAAGMQTISASDGTFVLEGVPVWTHNVVVASLDGQYATFQQGALIAEHATTPIEIGLQKRSMVEVTFEVQTPDNFDTSQPMRLASNFYPLGYPEADLPSGSSMASANLPQFTKIGTNNYSLSVSLPAGADIRYKFTFGDGFWNAELSESGNFVSRKLIVPTKDTTIRKRIQILGSPAAQRITINLTTPPSTPINDTVSLQLNPFGWMQPLPMQKSGENQWTYTLFTPLHLLGEIGYRFCRNDQCENAASNPIQEGTLAGSTETQNITVSLSSWPFMETTTVATSVDVNGGNLLPRPDFIAGFEIIANMPSSWNKSIDQGLQTISSSGGNWVIFSPTWTVTNDNPPQLEPVAGNDFLWPDQIDLGTRIIANGLQPVIFPRISSQASAEQLWLNGIKDGGWWLTFFDRYQHFVLQSADLAKILNASGIMIGDPAMKPSMNSGLLSNGTAFTPPANADEYWIELIQLVRSRYNGPVIGVISIPEQNSALPTWIKDVDALYVLFTPSLEGSSEQSVESLESAFSSALDTYIQPIANQYGKPILIGINPPATPTAVNGCLALNNSCMENNEQTIFAQPLDLDLQSRIYNAAIIASASKPWIRGFISREYDPLVVVKDQRASVYGKPAWDVLWFWYHYILNKPS